MRPVLSRHRRLLAALLAAAAAALALTATRGHPRAGVPVLVAAHDLRPGSVIGREDVTWRSFAAGTVPSGVVARAEGRVVSGPVRRGEPLTDARFGSSLLPGRDPAAVAAPVRLADAAVARLLRPGDRVDVLAARTDAPSEARTVASSVPVVAVPKPGPDTDEGALIVIQADRDQAALLARAAVDSRLSVTIVGP